VRVERLGPDDWRAWKDLRLEALADTPIGYGELLADAASLTDEEWAEKVNNPPRPGVRFIAYDGEEPLGMAGGFLDEHERRVLFGVYVRPAHRGGAVVAALVDAVAAWAAPEPLVLHVHEDNDRARRAYENLGFVLTGEVSPGGGIDGRDLHWMTR
jgi:RimJ/RimL family protein N-acetyltransferase